MSKLLEHWKELNREHNAIIRELNRKYGGPDVRELEPELFQKIEKLAAGKNALEAVMSNEELNSLP